ncbi:hypothetical protein C2G38_2229364 [Gigaspora rosea]|uniref:Uncharacterized protein n=1 Tax=Gigaspora rosea TaxID=44941 RepID=A0A397TZH9_9GLOM|nr:hypothetical protein C2G38_2229364 [Gigaspora rosea]
MMRDSINKALKQWRHINDDNRKSLVVYGFTQDANFKIKQSKLKKAEETVIKLHSADIINKRRLITNENRPNLNMNRTPP